MAINLEKGGNTSLTRDNPGLSAIGIGLGWDARSTDGDEFDLDAMAFLVNSEGRVASDEDFVFYNNPRSACGSVLHEGDNRTGAGEGDDEKLNVNLAKVPPTVSKISICASIHKASERRQNFGMVENAFIRIYDQSSVEIVRFDLSEDFGMETAVIFGEVYRNGVEWKFRAVGQGFRGGIEKLLEKFGLKI